MGIVPPKEKPLKWQTAIVGLVIMLLFIILIASSMYNSLMNPNIPQTNPNPDWWIPIGITISLIALIYFVVMPAYSGVDTPSHR